MKRKLAILLIIVLPFCFCSCSTEPSANLQEQNSTSEPIVLQVWISDRTSAMQYQLICEQFARYEEETGISTSFTELTYDAMRDKILAAAAGGNAPDLVFGLQEWIGEFYNMGILEDLTFYYETWEEASHLSDAVLATQSIDGKLVGVPYQMTVRAYLCHQSMLDAASIAVPSTWEEVLALSEVYDSFGFYPYELACIGPRATQEMMTYLAQYELEICSAEPGGGYRNTWLEDTSALEQATKVFAFYRDCLQQGVVSPNSKTWGYEETDTNFVAMQSATYVTGNWLREREIDFSDEMEDITVHAIPKPADGVDATYMECKPLMIFSSSKHKREAFNLATAVCGKEWQQAVYANVSPRDDVVMEGKWGADFTALSKHGVSFPPVTMGGIAQAMTDSLHMVLVDGVSPDEAALWLSEAVNTALKESGELSLS